MQIRARFVAVVVLLCAIAALPAVAQGADPSGHWEGSIEIPGQPLAVRVDLEAVADGLTGTIDIPAQGANDLPLVDVVLDGSHVTFTIQGVPGTPTFDGSVDKTAMTGDFKQGGATFPFSLERTDTPTARASDALDGIDQVIEKALADFGVPGLAVGVVVDGDVVLAEGYGLRDVDGDKPVTADTLFAIGSATKAFTTFVLGQLVDEGVIDWDDPVRDHLPELRLYDEHATAALTIRDLVSHRSGLPRHDMVWYGDDDVERSELMKALRYLEPYRDLREEWHYQNLMFMAAGYLIEHLTGESWEDNVRERIFEPLGMDRSNFSVETSQADADFALPYNYSDGETEQVPFRSVTAMGPAGSINSSIDDMVRWLQLQLGGGTIGGEQLIEPTTLREMHTPVAIVSGYPDADDDAVMTAYGLGWFVEAYRGHYRVQHGGGIDGFITMVSFLPMDGIGVVTLSNASGVGLSPLINMVVTDRLLGEPNDERLDEALAKMKAAEKAGEKAEEELESVRIEGTSPSHPLADYVGTYHHPGYGDLVVGENDGGLEITFNRMTHPLEHWHYDVFRVPDDDGIGLGGLEIQFRTGMDGYVSEVVSPLEPEVGLIAFEHQPDPRLRDPEYLARFAGTYRFAEQDVEATVAVRGDALVVTVAGQPPMELDAKRGTTFELEAVEGVSLTFVEEDGAITAVRFNQPNGVYTAERVEEDGE